MFSITIPLITDCELDLKNIIKKKHNKNDFNFILPLIIQYKKYPYNYDNNTYVFKCFK